MSAIDFGQDRCPPGVNWNYSRAELMADGFVHAIGLALGLIGAVALCIRVSAFADHAQQAAVLVYSVGLLTVLGLSAAYNLWPVSPCKWVLRRFDHAAIFILIAATYTPFLTQLKGTSLAAAHLVIVWLTAFLGVALKLLLPGRFDRAAIALYLLLGWSGVILYDQVIAPLPTSTIGLLAAGGLLYTVGVVFHVWQSLPFQNAIWHGFVVLAATCHYFAVLTRVA